MPVLAWRGPSETAGRERSNKNKTAAWKERVYVPFFFIPLTWVAFAAGVVAGVVAGADMVDEAVSRRGWLSFLSSSSSSSLRLFFLPFSPQRSRPWRGQIILDQISGKTHSESHSLFLFLPRQRPKVCIVDENTPSSTIHSARGGSCRLGCFSISFAMSRAASFFPKSV